MAKFKLLITYSEFKKIRQIYPRLIVKSLRLIKVCKLLKGMISTILLFL